MVVNRTRLQLITDVRIQSLHITATPKKATHPETESVAFGLITYTNTAA